MRRLSAPHACKEASRCEGAAGREESESDELDEEGDDDDDVEAVDSGEATDSGAEADSGGEAAADEAAALTCTGCTDGETREADGATVLLEALLAMVGAGDAGEVADESITC